eukprot:4104473-Prymnesium_polylepis.2
MKHPWLHRGVLPATRHSSTCCMLQRARQLAIAKASPSRRRPLFEAYIGLAWHGRRHLWARVKTGKLNCHGRTPVEVSVRKMLSGHVGLQILPVPSLVFVFDRD